MFKFKSYSVKKAEENNDKTSKTSSSTATLKKTTAPSYSTGTLKKTTSSKQKTMPTAGEIKAVSNKQSPDYSRKIYPKKTVTNWHTNKTFSAKNETKKEAEKVVIPSPHKKLERK